MDKQQAQNIIKETFENPFDKDRFTGFVKNLLNQIDDSHFAYYGKFIPDAYKPFIGRYERIGKYSDSENRIDILIVYLNKETSIERARTRQRNFIAGYLEGNYGSDISKDAALVAFVSPNENDWRFSLVKMDYKFKQTTTGNTKVKEEFTPARRWSFLVGKNESSHTAQSRLVPILTDDRHNPTLAQLEEAFNIEKVTKEFFEKYRDLFLRTKETLDEIVKQDSKIKADFEAKSVDTVNFAKKLLGQIVFLYFLQKKGWFGVERDAEWGTGTKQFLRELFFRRDEFSKGGNSQHTNFFNDILEPLFYEALRRPRDDDYYSHFNCKIPFLNGGLFDPINNYDWVHTDILLPNELFSNRTKTKEGDTGNGILDIFDRYNFTVKEDEPLEKEVAIDPEMLGKVFENLLEVKDRKSKGTYYTPREIVHYMCQQSLINYLYTELNKGITSYQKIGDTQTDAFGNEVKTGQFDLIAEHKSSPQISKEDLETLIKYGEQVGENDATVEVRGKETDTYSYKLPESIRQNAKLIDEKLASIKVCDPAIGSGAFPVGMMHEIVKTRNVLTTFLNPPSIPPLSGDTGGLRTIYHFKRRCIEKSLYGVDIDPGAVEIAKLRLWLSLVVDEDDIKQIKPLPNLDYKIVCGNSLLGVKRDLLNDYLFKELEQLKPLYFNETNPTKKQEYKRQIDGLISRITDGHKEFDFEVYFSEVFHEKDGFDVVIANPPYLKERNNKKVFESVNNSDFGKKYHQGKMDYWYYFLHKAIDVARKKGIISYITSRYWLNSSGAKKLIQRVKKEISFVSFVDIGKLKVFDEVAGQHMVAVYAKNKALDNFLYKKLINDLTDIDSKQNTDNISIKTFTNSKIFSHPHEILIEEDLIEFKECVDLGEICDVFQGVVQNPDKVSAISATKYDLPQGEGVFVLNCHEYKTLKLNAEERSFVRPFFDECDIHKYLIRPQEEKYLIYLTPSNCKNIDTLPNLKKHLIKYKQIMDVRRETKKGVNKWFHLHWPRREEQFAKKKLILPAMFERQNVGYMETEGYFGLSSNIIIQKNTSYSLKYILAILNSSLALDWFYRYGKKRGVGVDIGVNKLRTFPIKKPSLKVQEPFKNCVDRILSITKDEDYLQNPQKQARVKTLEREIDRMVYELYGLTNEEIKIVEGENVKYC